jgi:hypothetical protein
MRLGDNLSGLVRFDWMMPNGHSLTVRGDWNWNGQDPARVGTLSLPHTGGTTEGWGAGLMATHTSILGGRFLNELKVYGSVNDNASRSFLSVPSGRVQVASDLIQDSARGISTLTFGGNPSLTQDGALAAWS